jgi:hypothetical protein
MAFPQVSHLRPALICGKVAQDYFVTHAHPPLPSPWSIEELNDACFIVIDGAGQKLAYVYFEEEPGRRSAAKLLTKDEARRIAANMAGRSRCCCAASIFS